MFGLINSTIEDVKYNVSQMIQYDLPHLSVYNLTIEEQTVFHHRRKNNQLEEISDDLQKEQFYLINDLLAESGYEHYEISNYAQQGFQAKHNTNYWDRVPYLGVGPAAHSLIGKRRTWNISNNNKYINSDELIRQMEELSENDIYNERIMLGLRRKEGLLKSHFYRFSTPIKEYFGHTTKRLLELDQLEETKDRYKLPEHLWYISDHIAAEMFME